jgi:hypothetical protein
MLVEAAFLLEQVDYIRPQCIRSSGSAMVPSLVEKREGEGSHLVKNLGLSWLWLTVASKGSHLGLQVKLTNSPEDGRKLCKVSTTEEVEELSSAATVLQWSVCKCVWTTC